MFLEENTVLNSSYSIQSESIPLYMYFPCPVDFTKSYQSSFSLNQRSEGEIEDYLEMRVEGSKK